MISEFKEDKIFAGNDQSLYAFAILRYPNLFATVFPGDYSYDQRFMQQIMWSSSYGKYSNRNEVPQPERQILVPNPDYAQLYNSQCLATLMILSTTNSQFKRHKIRMTWLGTLMKRYPNSFTYKFIIGSSQNISVENTMYKDILELPMTDSYRNLSVKVLLGFKALQTNCKYIFKIDDDFGVNVDNFVKLVVSIPNYRVYGGYIYDQHYRISEVDRNPNSVNGLSRSDYSFDFFEPYAGGPMYFLSSTIVKDLPYSIVKINENESIPSVYVQERSPLFKLEDVYISRLISSMCGVTYLHVNNMYAVFPNKIDFRKAVGYHSFYH
jgi:hypothetical protein